jgi:large subunit ribosomal protein L28
VHRVAKIRQNLFRAAAAGFVFIRVARLAPNQLAVFECHASSANPVFPVADVDMIELCHASILSRYNLLSCGTAVFTDRILVSQFPGDFRNMARICDVCGRGPQFGHRVSHAHNVSKRRWNLNLQPVRAVVNGATKRLRVCTSCIRSGKVQKAA